MTLLEFKEILKIKMLSVKNYFSINKLNKFFFTKEFIF